jgi:hypothetical protein
MSTHGAGRPSGSTYYAASYHPPGPPAPQPTYGGVVTTVDAPRPRPSPGPAFPVSGMPFSPGPAAPARPNRNLPILLGLLAVVLVLGIGGGTAVYVFFLAGDSPAGPVDRPAAVETSSSGPAGTVASTPTAAATSPAAPPPGGEEEVSGDLSGFRQGDCLTVDQAKNNRVAKAKCTDPGAQKVLLRKNGTLDDSVCQSTKATFSLSQDATGSAKDFVLCVGPVD